MSCLRDEMYKLTFNLFMYAYLINISIKLSLYYYQYIWDKRLRFGFWWWTSKMKRYNLDLSHFIIISRNESLSFYLYFIIKMIFKIDIEEKMILSMFKKLYILQYFKCNLLNLIISIWLYYLVCLLLVIILLLLFYVNFFFLSRSLESNIYTIYRIYIVEKIIITM